MKRYLLLLALAISPMLHGAAKRAAKSRIEMVHNLLGAEAAASVRNNGLFHVGGAMAKKNSTVTYQIRKSDGTVTPFTMVYPADQPLLSSLASYGDPAYHLKYLLSDLNPEYVKKINELSDNAEGMSPLGYAATHGHCKVIELLLEKGALIDIEDKTGYTPLMRAIYNDQINAAKLLVVNGAKKNCLSPSPRNDSLLTLAVESASADMVRYVLTLIEPKNLTVELSRKKLGYKTALEIAENMFRDPTMLNLLRGNIPLHQARKNMKEIIRILEEAEKKAKERAPEAAMPGRLASAAGETKAAAASARAPAKNSKPDHSLAERRAPVSVSLIVSDCAPAGSAPSGGEKPKAASRARAKVASKDAYIDSATREKIRADARAVHESNLRRDSVVDSGDAKRMAEPQTEMTIEKFRALEKNAARAHIKALIKAKNYAAAQAIIDAEAEPDGNNLFHLVAAYGSLAELKEYVLTEKLVDKDGRTDRPPKDLNVENYNLLFPIDFAGRMHNFVNVEYLYSVGFGVENETILHLAAYELNIDYVDRFSKDPRMVNQENSRGRTPLMELVNSFKKPENMTAPGHIKDVVKMLADANCPLVSIKYNSYMDCVEFGNHALLKCILRNSKPLEILEFAKLALAEASKNGFGFKDAVDLKNNAKCVRLLEEAIKNATALLKALLDRKDLQTPKKESPSAAGEKKNEAAPHQCEREEKKRIEKEKVAQQARIEAERKHKEEAEIKAKQDAAIAKKREQEKARKERQKQNRLARAAGSAVAGTSAGAAAGAPDDFYVDLPEARESSAAPTTSAPAGTVESKKDIEKDILANPLQKRLEALRQLIGKVTLDKAKKDSELDSVKKQLEVKNLAPDEIEALTEDEVAALTKQRDDLLKKVARDRVLLERYKERKAAIELALNL